MKRSKCRVNGAQWSLTLPAQFPDKGFARALSGLTALSAMMLLSAGPAWSEVSSPTGIIVSYKLDPRLVSGVYGGEHWVSPSTYTTTLNPVEARAMGIDGKGASVRISAEWIPADPELVTVSPSQGEQTKITVKRAGQSRLTIRSQGIVKELAIKATSKGEAKLQVEISEVRDAATPAAARTLETQKERLSYALGANLGNGLRREAIEVDSEVVIQGLKDALSGSTSLLTQHEISVAVATLKGELTSKRITAAAEKINATKELAEKNKKDGEAFLAQNKAKEGIVTLESGLQYKVLKSGNGSKPTTADVVVCNYRGTLIDGRNRLHCHLQIPGLSTPWRLRTKLCFRQKRAAARSSACVNCS